MAPSCESEFRVCALSTSFDSDFDSFLVEWHEACDKYLSASITTPPLAEPTRTLEQGVCESIVESCDRFSKGRESCTSFQSGGPESTGCRCDRTLLSQASICAIDRETCAGSKLDVTNMWEYKNCPGASTFFIQGAQVRPFFEKAIFPMRLTWDLVMPDHGEFDSQSNHGSRDSFSKSRTFGFADLQPPDDNLKHHFSVRCQTGYQESFDWVRWCAWRAYGIVLLGGAMTFLQSFNQTSDHLGGRNIVIVSRKLVLDITLYT
ncbi:hypothetical protein BCR34DRAFT_567095 [Clohesyomyces aquaticus]|uniref:Uncharacterized protein n=1 Tax=Clohesyomyces aquaticus TaxID=1231657 RepID=A0A1Y1ZJ35_9PLEO|nr:hypothetical protein BCR34DRAFT_567095 [Clohesyomyces aquaticus]